MRKGRIPTTGLLPLKSRWWENPAIEVVLRPAEVADAALIASSHVRSWQAGYADVVSAEVLKNLGSDLPARTLRWQTIIIGAEAENRFVLVGEIGDEIAGWLSGGPCRPKSSEEPSLGEIYGCYVDPAHWRKGVGSALMAAGTQRLTEAGHTTAVLWVLEDNLRARAFYEHHGWHEDGARKLYELGDRSYPELRYRRLLA